MKNKPHTSHFSCIQNQKLQLFTLQKIENFTSFPRRQTEASSKSSLGFCQECLNAPASHYREARYLFTSRQLNHVLAFGSPRLTLILTSFRLSLPGCRVFQYIFSTTHQSGRKQTSRADMRSEAEFKTRATVNTKLNFLCSLSSMQHFPRPYYSHCLFKKANCPWYPGYANRAPPHCHQKA